MIELKDVTKSYQLGDHQLQVLHGVNFAIQEGELVALMGASGSGKTTTMNIVGLLDKPTSGQCFLNNQEVSKLSSDELATLRNQTIGFIFQLFYLLPRINAWDNVCLPLTYRNLSNVEIKKRAMDSLKRVGVADLAEHTPSQMSGGQQQRIAIARALVGNPKLILADEPTGALDSKTGQEVMNLLISLNREEKNTVLIVTHDINIAKQCQRIIRIIDGKIIDDKDANA